MLNFYIIGYVVGSGAAFIAVLCLMSLIADVANGKCEGDLK